MLGLLQGNFGIDFFGRPILGLILERLPTTFALAMTAWVLKLAIGLAIGVYGGLRHGRAGDHFALVFTVIFLGIPGFVIALGAQTVFGVQLGWVDPAGIRAGWPMAFILPALVMAVEASAGLARLTRTSLVDVLRAEYLRTARAKGLSPNRVIWGHALRNAMIPVVTYLGLCLAGMLGGAVLIEAIFNIPGIGGLMVTAINNKEGTVVVGIATMLVLVYLSSTCSWTCSTALSTRGYGYEPRDRNQPGRGRGNGPVGPDQPDHGPGRPEDPGRPEGGPRPEGRRGGLRPAQGRQEDQPRDRSGSSPAS